jgi:hypothetical protein
MRGLEDHRRRAFSLWLRTGRRVPDPHGHQIECKFNPWHDPRGGRFTFAGAGRYAGPGIGEPTKPVHRRAPKIDYVEDFSKAPLASLKEADAWRAQELAKHRGQPELAAIIEARYRRYRQAFAPQPRNPATPQPRTPLSRVASRVTNFANGFGDGLHDTGKGAVAGVYALATTIPLTTAQNVGRSLATTIDKAISAEDTPASVQIGRAANAIADASAHDVGYAVGTIAGDAGLAIAPGAVGAKIVRAARGARVVESGLAAEKTAPKAIWVDENNGLKRTLAKDYNDSATGARSNVQTRRGQAPALERTLPDGTVRLVRFDGVDGNSMTERKLRIVRSPKAKDQALRQADVLKQHGLTGIWEVPTETERKQAVKLLGNLGISNIRVRVVKPW